MSHGNDLILGRATRDGRPGPPVRMPAKYRHEHMYVAGSTGTGKSKFLEAMIRNDILNWRENRCGLLLMDPHGKLYDDVLAWATRYQLNRPIVPIDLRRNGWVVGYNLLRERPGADPAVIVDQIVEAIGHVWGQSEFSETPLLREWLTNIIRTLYDNRLSLLESQVFLDPRAKLARANLLEAVSDPAVKSAWQALEERSSGDFQDKIQSTRLRLRRFLDIEIVKLMLSQDRGLDIKEALENGSIVLVSLASEGNQISREAATLFGRLVLSDLWSAALERGKRDDVKPFYVYLDEFQRFITPSIGENLDEARGYGIHFILANQYPGQLTGAGEVGDRVYRSIAENSRNKVAFHLSDPQNLEPLAQIMFRNTFDPDEIKHKLRSRKVMDYQEELRQVASYSETESEGGSEQITESSGESVPDSEEGTPVKINTTAVASGSSWSRSKTHGLSDQIIQTPIMGSEVSSIQYRPIEEQLELAMATLHDQKQRHCIVKLRDMKYPAAVLTPKVETMEFSGKIVERYIARLLERSGYAVSEERARERLKEREVSILKALEMGDGRKGKSRKQAEEPTTSKRRVQSGDGEKSAPEGNGE